MKDKKFAASILVKDHNPSVAPTTIPLDESFTTPSIDPELPVWARLGIAQSKKLRLKTKNANFLKPIEFLFRQVCSLLLEWPPGNMAVAPTR
jgi:hypothetical protein